MKRLLILFFVLLPVLSFAKDVEIVKDATVLVPDSQSVDQVVKYTTDELARKASEEAGVSIYASTELIDGKITKEEVKLQTANVAKISQLEKKVFTDKKGRNHVYLKIKASINTDDLNKHLQLLTQNENLRKQLEQERKEKEKLAEEMRKASKEEFSDLNDEAERIAKAHQVRIALLEKDAAYAERILQENIDKQNKEREKQAKQLEEMRQAAKKKDEEDKKKILEAHDKEKKAELEYQARLNELIREAAINDKILSSESDNTLEFVMAEVPDVRTKFAALVRSFNAEEKANKKTMEIFYNEHINLIKNRLFLEEKPKERGEWETTATYNARVIEYEKRKSDFEKQKKLDIQQANLDYKAKIEKNGIETKKELLKALEPFYTRLKNYNNGKFVSSKVNKAVINFGDRDIDHNTLKFTIKLGMNKYDYTYNFDNLDDFKIMYETRFSFIAVPLYGLIPATTGNGAKLYLYGFNVIHLGMKKEVFYSVNKIYKIFPEITEYERMYSEVYFTKIEDDTNSSLLDNSQNSNFYYDEMTGSTIRITDSRYGKINKPSNKEDERIKESYNRPIDNSLSDSEEYREMVRTYAEKRKKNNYRNMQKYRDIVRSSSKKLEKEYSKIKQRKNYTKYFDYGINLGLASGGSGSSVFTEDSITHFFVEYGLRFGREYNSFGYYYNISGILSVGGDNSSKNSSKNDITDVGSNNEDIYVGEKDSSPSTETNTSWGLATGLGITYKFASNIYIYAEVNAMYLAPKISNKSGFGGNTKIGLNYGKNHRYSVGIYVGSYFGDIDYNFPLATGISFYF